MAYPEIFAAAAADTPFIGVFIITSPVRPIQVSADALKAVLAVLTSTYHALTA